MSNDAFSNDVTFGGLTDLSDIKLLICYVLKAANIPLTHSQIADVLLKDKLANYFSITQCIASLEKDGHIKNLENLCTLSESGDYIANTLESSLPLNVREKAVGTALSAAQLYRNTQQTATEVSKVGSGYSLVLKILDRELVLLETKIYFTDKLQAEQVRERFLQNPSEFYKKILSND